jgi:antitoxin (DNA-binding transcriptional repressor) of toxin-antitoxin stability system
MKRYSVAEARAHLTSLLDAVSAGEEVEITRRGKAIALLRRPDGGLADAIARWRTSAPPDAFVDDDWTSGLRDRGDTGRELES